MMAVMFGRLFRVVAKTFTVWWICPIKCLYALMFLDIPSQVLICPHVCPYALLAFVDFALFCMLIRSLLFCLVIRSEERLFNVFLIT